MAGPGTVSYNATLASLQLSLARADLDHFDLFLIHSPFDTLYRVDEWRALLDARKAGLLRSAGVSNYGVQELEEIRAAGLELPAVNQVQLHPWRTNDALRAYAQAHGIVLQAYGPLGDSSWWYEPVLHQIAADHSKPIPAVLLRWSMQLGVVPIFGTDDPSHLASDLQAVEEGFELTVNEMAAISALNADRSIPGYDFEAFFRKGD